MQNRLQFQTLAAQIDLPTTTFLEITDLGFEVEAGNTYFFTADVSARMHATPDFKMRIDAPDGEATVGHLAVNHVENAVSRTPPCNTSTGNLTSATSTTADSISVSGWLTPATSGRVQFFAGRNTAGTADHIVFVAVGSWSKAERID